MPSFFKKICTRESIALGSKILKKVEAKDYWELNTYVDRWPVLN